MMMELNSFGRDSSWFFLHLFLVWFRLAFFWPWFVLVGLATISEQNGGGYAWIEFRTV
jgi:hypothetical protein